MSGKRVAQVNELLKKELGQLFLKEIEFPQDTLVTITRVETSADLKLAKVFFSVFPLKAKEKILNLLVKNKGHLQPLLNKRLVMKWVPEINFQFDEDEERAWVVEDLLDKIDAE